MRLKNQLFLHIGSLHLVLLAEFPNLESSDSILVKRTVNLSKLVEFL